MTHLTLTDTCCQFLGLVPGGPIEPAVVGLEPVQRRHGGWLFRITEPWKLEVVRETVRSCPAAPAAARTRRALVSRLGLARFGQP